MQSARVTEKEENKKTRASRTKTPVRKADLARDPGGVGGGGEGAREREQGKTETETCSQETDRHTDTQTERHGKVQRQGRVRKKKREDKEVREQEKESWQKLIESNRMKIKYPERVGETQGGHGVTWRDGHTDRGGQSPRSIRCAAGGT